MKPLSEYAFDLLPFYYYEILDKKNNSVGKISLRIGYNEYTIYNGMLVMKLIRI